MRALAAEVEVSAVSPNLRQQRAPVRIHTPGGFDPLLALVELDVAATRVAAAQVATGEIAVGQLDFEYVVAARFALVAHPHARRAGLVVDHDGVVDDPAIGIIRIRLVSGDRGGLHVHPGGMIDVVEVAPERSVPDTTRHTEVGLGARRRAGDPPAARHEVPALGRRYAA